jgi:hypothetical protein
MSEPLIFDDLTPREKRFPIGPRQFILREPSEAAAVRYRNFQARSTKFADGKPSGIAGDILNADPVLLSDCLFELMPGGGGERQVSVDEINRWPARVVTPLVKLAKELGELEEKETPETLAAKIEDLQEQRRELLGRGEGGDEGEPEKNGRTATPVTSA